MYSGVMMPCCSAFCLPCSTLEELAGLLQTHAAIGQCEGEGFRVEHVAAEDVAILGLKLTFGDPIDLILIDRARKALERTFGVHVLNRDAGTVRMRSQLTTLVAVLKELEREATQEPLA